MYDQTILYTTWAHRLMASDWGSSHLLKCSQCIANTHSDLTSLDIYKTLS